MRTITGTREFQIQEPTVVTIGKFDGRHKGHQKLLRRMQEIQQEYGYRTAVFTFDRAPGGVVAGTAQGLITTSQERRDNMEKMGIDYLVEYPFSQQVARMSPEDFVRVILVGQMHARAVVAGPDCGFGYQRAGNADLLRRLAPELGYQVNIIVVVTYRRQ